MRNKIMIDLLNGWIFWCEFKNKLTVLKNSPDGSPGYVSDVISKEMAVACFFMMVDLSEKSKKFSR